MKRFILFLLGAMAFSNVSQAQAQACVESSHTYKNCTYEAPALKNGERQTLSNANEALFSGAVAARCLSGKVHFSAESCAPKQAGDCGVQKSTWRSVDKQQTCSHDTKEMVISNGSDTTIYDPENAGKIDYRCDDGVLKATSFYCPSGTPSVSRKMDANVTTQAVTTEVSQTRYLVSIYTETNIGAYSAAAKNLAQQECMRVSSLYEPGTLPAVVVKSYRSQGTGYTFNANCVVSVEVDACSSGLEAMGLPGQMSSTTGEASNPPTHATINNQCVARGYTGVQEIHSIERTYNNVIDDFTVLATCQGKASACGATEPEPTFNAAISQATSCTEARATGGLLRVARGDVPSQASLKTNICQALSFNNIAGVVSTTLEDQTGAYDYYQATVNCSEYQDDGSNPLLESCAGPIDTGGSGGISTPFPGAEIVSMTRLTCDTMLVSGTMIGVYSPTKGGFVAPPPPQDVLEAFCLPNQHAVLDSIESIELFDGADEYGVIATCSSYQGADKALCSDESGCYGEEVSPESSEVKICDHTGKCYKYTCGVQDPPSSALCTDCTAGAWEFSANGNTCAVDVPMAYSGGGSGEVDFFTDTHSGTVEFGCQSGNRTLHQGTCFKNCSGGQAVQWADARGSNNCGQVVPAGTYRHGETVTLGTSLEHTGNSEVECDDGQWKVLSGRCLLDCEGTFAWGTGTALNGQSKNGACSASLGRVSHGQTASANSSVFLTTGSATARCSDGRYLLNLGLTEPEWDPRFNEPIFEGLEDTSTCNIGCPSAPHVWSMCSSGGPNLLHNRSTNLSHSGGSSYRFDSFTNGTAELSCNDGLASLNKKVCNYVISQGTDYGTWTTYTTQCTGYSPSTATYPGGERFTQTRSCTPKQRRTVRDQYNWASGATTYGSSVYAYRDLAPYSQSREAIGTGDPEPISSSSTNGPLYDYGSASCGNYSPSADDYFTDETVEQSRTCTQPRRYIRTTTTTMSDGSTVDTTSVHMGSSRTYTQNNTTVGTKTRAARETIWRLGAKTRCVSSIERNFHLMGEACANKGDSMWLSEREPCMGGGYMAWLAVCR